MNFLRRTLLITLSGLLQVATVLAQADGTHAATTEPEAPPEIVLRPAIPAYYPGCDELPEGSEEKASCSVGKLMGFISRTLEYPDEAREQNIQGVVVLSFVVTDEGAITDVRTLRSIGGGCAEEAARVIAEMPRWQPAIHKGEVAYTQFTLPITFGLKTDAYDYALHTGDLTDTEVSRGDAIAYFTSEDLAVTDPKGNTLTITEVVYTVERGGQMEQLVTRGAERPDEKALAKLIGRKPARLIVEANVVDGLDIRTVTRNFVVTK